MIIYTEIGHVIENRLFIIYNEWELDAQMKVLSDFLNNFLNIKRLLLSSDIVPNISKVIKTLLLNENPNIDTKDPAHNLTDIECLQGLLTERQKLDKNKLFPNRIGYRTYEEVLERLVVLDRMIAELVGKDEEKVAVKIKETNCC
ncbi:hypothetical protein V6C27_06860 [Peptococcaceae bacterium 1198_IL3148]